MFNKKLKEELQSTKADLEQAKRELQEAQNFLDMFRSTKNAKYLIEEARKECYSNADKNRLRLLEQSINDINYRSYITKTQKGKVCLDIQQIPISDEEIAKLLR